MSATIIIGYVKYKAIIDYLLTLAYGLSLNNLQLLRMSSLCIIINSLLSSTIVSTPPKHNRSTARLAVDKHKTKVLSAPNENACA